MSSLLVSFTNMISEEQSAFEQIKPGVSFYKRGILWGFQACFNQKYSYFFYENLVCLYEY